MTTGRAPGKTDGELAAADPGSSIKVFQELQPGQRPSHLCDWYPHSWQQKVVLTAIHGLLKLKNIFIVFFIVT
jgi:hypothetical protein